MKNYYLFIIFAIMFSFLSCNKEKDEIEEDLFRISILNGNFQIEVNKPININYKAIGPNIDSVALFINDISYINQTLTEGYFQFYLTQVGYYFIKVVAYHSGGIAVPSQTIRLQTLHVNNPIIDMIVQRQDGDAYYYVGEAIDIQFISKSDWFNFEDCKTITVKINDSQITTLESPYILQLDTTNQETYTIELTLITQDNSIYTINKTFEIPINTFPSVKIRYEDTHFNRRNVMYLKEGSEAILPIYASDNIGIRKIELYCNNSLLFEEDFSYQYYIKDILLDTLTQWNYTFFIRVFDDRGFMTQSDNFYVNFSPSIDLLINESIIDAIAIKNSPFIYLATSKKRLLQINTAQKTIENIYFIPYANIRDMVYDTDNLNIIMGLANGMIYKFYPLSGSLELFEQNYFHDIHKICLDHSLDQLMVAADEKIYSLDLNSLDTNSYPFQLRQNCQMEYDENNKTLYVAEMFMESELGIGQFNVEKNNITLNQHSGDYDYSIKSFIIIPENQTLFAQFHYDKNKYLSTINLGEEVGELEPSWITAYIKREDTLLFFNSLGDKLIYSDLNGQYFRDIYLEFIEFKDINFIVPGIDDNNLIFIIKNGIDDYRRILFFEDQNR